VGDKKEWICRPASEAAGQEIEQAGGAEAARECRMGMIIAAVNEKEARQFAAHNFEELYGAEASEDWFYCEIDEEPI
jgi:hypothetical protein